MEDEIRARRPKCEKILRGGDALAAKGHGHPAAQGVGERVASLRENWARLEALVAERKKQLDDAAEACAVSTTE